MPGTVCSGKVETFLQAISTGQTQASGLAVTPKAVESAPFVVRVKLDDQELSKRLPAGSTGTAAIFTEAVKADPPHPQGAAAADSDPQLRQSFLTELGDLEPHLSGRRQG
jgi:hypothetical protein